MELVQVSPDELKEVVQASKIELTKAEAIAANYAPILAEVQAQMEVVKTLVKGEAAHVEKAKRVRIDLGRIASKAAAQKKADKDELLLQTRFIDALFNTVEGAARITQNEAKEIEEHFERMEAERKAVLRAERWAALSEFMEHEPIGLDTMEQPVFDTFLSGARFAHEAKLKAEQDAEAERLRLIEEQRIEQERIRKENERLKAEAEAKMLEEEEQRKARYAEMLERSKIAGAFLLSLGFVHSLDFGGTYFKSKISIHDTDFCFTSDSELESFKSKVTAELKAKDAESARLAAERELQAKQDAEAKAERERLAEIERQRKEAEKLAKAPIKKQLTVWVDSFAIAPPSVSHQVSTEINNKFEAFKAWAKTQIENL
jgi:hypothetical protein